MFPRESAGLGSTAGANCQGAILRKICVRSPGPSRPMGAALATMRALWLGRAAVRVMSFGWFSLRYVRNAGVHEEDATERPASGKGLPRRLDTHPPDHRRQTDSMKWPGCQTYVSLCRRGVLAVSSRASSQTKSELSRSTIRAPMAQDLTSVDGPQSLTRDHRPSPLAISCETHLFIPALVARWNERFCSWVRRRSGPVATSRGRARDPWPR